MFYLWLCSGSLIEQFHSFYYLLGEWSFPSMCPYSNLILRPGRFHSSVEVSMSLLLIAHCLSIHALRIHLLVDYFLYATMIRGLSANVFIAWVQRVHSHVLTNDTKWIVRMKMIRKTAVSVRDSSFIICMVYSIMLLVLIKNTIPSILKY